MSPVRWNSACWRETVTSSRKISLSGCRPACTTSSSSRNREPEPGPRWTTSSAWPVGQRVDRGRVDRVELALTGLGLARVTGAAELDRRGGLPRRFAGDDRVGRGRGVVGRWPAGCRTASRTGRRRGSCARSWCRTAPCAPSVVVGHRARTLRLRVRPPVPPNLSAVRSEQGGTPRGAGAAVRPVERGFVRRRVQQPLELGRVARHHLEQPAAAVGVVVDQLGGGVERLVAGDDLAGDRRVDVADRLGRLQLATGGAGLDRSPSSGSET